MSAQDAVNGNQIPRIQGRTTVRPEGFFGSDRPGTQGQLLTGAHTHSWPRGYTPERQRDIDSMLPQDITEYGPNNARIRAVQSERHEGWGPPNAHRAGPTALRAELRDNLARSTMPASDLQGLGSISRNTREVLPTALGEYHREASGGSVRTSGQPRIKIRDDARPETLLHEIGHHVSAEQGTHHSAAYGLAAQARGEEEAFAENYAQQHTRRRKGGEPESAAYDWGTTAYTDNDVEKQSFRRGYAVNRNVNPTQFVQNEQAFFRGEVPDSKPWYAKEPDKYVQEGPNAGRQRQGMLVSHLMTQDDKPAAGTPYYIGAGVDGEGTKVIGGEPPKGERSWSGFVPHEGWDTAAKEVERKSRRERLRADLAREEANQ